MNCLNYNKIFVFQLIFISCVSDIASTNNVPGKTNEVKTKLGSVIGHLKSESDVRKGGSQIQWMEYLGIPYAEPPIGERRLAPPVPLSTPWTSPISIKSTNFRPVCTQLWNGAADPRNSEDCLQLNVYVPEESVSEGLPVMVYIHGGQYISGDGTPESFGPIYFMGHGVIVVSINYRLGPLGFMSLGTKEAPGNQGMLDQVLALTWIQENINNFGGDPNLVTIFGQSAGSFSSTYHLYSPLSNGLFKRVIAQSGVGGFAPGYHHFQQDQALRYGDNAATLLNCLDLDNRLDCLQGKDALDIQKVDTVMEKMSQPSMDTNISPTPFLPINPYQAVKEGNYNTEVDIMLGSNEDEGLMITEWFVSAPDLFQVLASSWDIMGPYSLLQKHHTEIKKDDVIMAKNILDFYTNGGGVDSLGPDCLTNITNMFTDSYFWFGIDLFLDNHLAKSQGKTYQYRFSYYGDYHRLHAPGLHHEDSPGVTHSDELYFFWNQFYNVSYPLDKEDQAMSLKLTTMWTNFAKFGEPTLIGEPTNWTAQSPTSRQYLRIDKEMKMELADDYLERVNFWKTFIDKMDFLNISK